MAKFIIRIEDPIRYEDQILSFWSEYLPGTPFQRFQWMNLGNPAGNSIWFFAFDKMSTDLAGLITIMPKELMVQGRKIRAGIVGDFMVTSRYRVFGPTFPLINNVFNSYKELGFHVLYTIPNKESLKIIMKAGFTPRVEIATYVKPIDSYYYLQKRFSPFLARLLAPLISFVMRLISLDTYFPLRGCFNDDAEIDTPFDHVCNNMIAVSTGMISNRTSPYLVWRYKHNPQYNFKVLSYRERPDSELSGYAIYTMTEDSRIIIYDLVITDHVGLRMLICWIIRLAYHTHCRAVQITLSTNNHTILSLLKKFRFLDADEKAVIMVAGGENIPIEDWRFFSGDRNI